MDPGVAATRDVEAALPRGIGLHHLPGLSAETCTLLRSLRDHPQAPRFHNESGHRLSAAQIHQARDYEVAMAGRLPAWPPGGKPAWLDRFVASTCATVPAFRHRDPRVDFEALPTTCRADLARDPVPYIADSVEPDDLITYITSGTTGHPLRIPSTPLVAARYLAFHRMALRRFGIELRSGRGDVGIVLAGFQRRCFTYLSACPTQDECVLVKLNLHPDDWRHPEDRAVYLDRLAPELVSGDPISLTALADLPCRHRPRALLSTSMALLPGKRRALEARFDCPLLDLYSMNEAGPIAVFDPAAGGHRLLQPDLYVEILDPQGRSLAPGERGEITLTGGFNRCLPLLRYRTGDHAALLFPDFDAPLLHDLGGRPPVRFRTTAGAWINNLEITHALQDLALCQYRLLQRADGSLQLEVQGSADAALLAARLRALMGADRVIDVATAVDFPDKVVQYRSELPGAAP